MFEPVTRLRHYDRKTQQRNLLPPSSQETEEHRKELPGTTYNLVPFFLQSGPFPKSSFSTDSSINQSIQSQSP